MFNLQSECDFMLLSSDNVLTDFDCGDADLNEFFNVDAIKYQEQMLGQTCFFRHKQSGKTVCAFSLSPDSLNTANLPNSRKKKVKENIPHEKPMKSYPAFLIGRLGVATAFDKQGVGSQLLKFIKLFCSESNPCNCRFLLVDAYNKPEILNFYQKNDFRTVFSTEEQEREYKKLDNSVALRTRYMYYDMIFLKTKMDVTV